VSIIGFIKERVRIIGMRGNKEIMALFDTWAYRNYLRKDMLEM
jgi:hypothetical protein